MKWWRAFQRLRELGILGMNRRNARCILDFNPRSRFPLVDSKQQMQQLCATIQVPTPRLYGVIRAHSALRGLEDLLADRDDFVLKPDRGAGGRGILVVTGRDGVRFVRHNGEKLTVDDIRQQLSSIISGLYSLGGRGDAALIQQRVQPHPALEAVSYQGVADVRIIVYRDEPVMAMLRLPTKASNGRANLHQGGIGAGIDLDSGLTCRAVLRNRVTERHPDTGNNVVGVAVPYWSDILQMACRVSRAVGLGYLGVDVVLDHMAGPLLLEANARPGLAIQIANGQGLLPRLDAVDRTKAVQASADPPESCADAATSAATPAAASEAHS